MKTPFVFATIIACLSMSVSQTLSAQAKPVEENTPCLEEESANNTPRANESDANKQKNETKHACKDCGSH